MGQTISKERRGGIRLCRTYYDLWEQFIPSGNRIAVNQGGTRSGKTFSILQFLIEVAVEAHRLKMAPMVITVCRKTLPALKATAMRDFISILETLDLYQPNNHNKTASEYMLYGTMFEFIGVDESQKVRGRKRDILFCNEANEISLEDFRQLSMRTTDKVIVDYNPSDEFHWIYDELLSRKDATMFKTTYRDNPFLSQSLVAEIELLKEADPNYWRIYGEGERAVNTASVFPEIVTVNEFPSGIKYCFGLDFGFTHPTALVRVGVNENKLYWKQELYSTNLTTNELVSKLKTILADNPRATIYADPSRPETIRELQLAGFNMGVTKNRIYEGIQAIKKMKFHVTSDSVELLKELRAYKWKTNKQGNNLDEPIGLNDHAIDAGRYGTYSSERAVVPRARFNLNVSR